MSPKKHTPKKVPSIKGRGASKTDRRKLKTPAGDRPTAVVMHLDKPLSYDRSVLIALQASGGRDKS